MYTPHAYKYMGPYSLPEWIVNREPRYELYKAMSPYNAFLVLVRSNYGRTFGFFIPEKFKMKFPGSTKKQLLFYFTSDKNSL